MANHPLRTIVAHAFQIIHQKSGYVPPSKNKDRNTPTEVLAALNRGDELNLTYWTLADDTIDFFRNMEKHPEYKSIMARADGPEFQAAADAAKNAEVSTITFGTAVSMPHLYARLKPELSKAPKLNPNKTVAKIFTPGEFLGTLHKPERFFVKLVFVGRADNSKGTLFKVLDRVGNIGFFYDRPEKFQGKVHLGDCFAMHATPSRHTPAENGEKHTIFRGIEFIAGSLVEGKTPVDPKFDESTGKVFTRAGVPF
jgi:hypothetical protein